ncbi:hypothetical protein D3C81_1457320 [compost metagenome]
MHVDKARCQHQAVAFDHVRGGIGIDRAAFIDAGNVAVAQRHVGQARGGAGAVDQRNESDQGIEQVWHGQSPSGWRLSGPRLGPVSPRWLSSTSLSRRSRSLLWSCCSNAHWVASTSSTISIA